MANPMEQMAVSVLSKLTGMTPEQMQQLAANGVNLLQSLDGRLQAIEAVLAKIDTQMGAQNGDGK